MFDKIFKAIRKAELGVTGAIFVSALVVLTLNVIFRRISWMPTLDWAEEYMRYCSIWVTFIGMAICAEDDLHIGVDVVYQLSPTKAKKVLKILCMFCAFVFCAAFTYASVNYALMAASNMQRSAVMRVPLSIIYLALPIGSGLSTLQYAMRLVPFIRVDHTSLEEKPIEDASEINMLELN